MSEQTPTEREPRDGTERRPARRAARAVVAVPKAIFWPFVALYRSLREIWRDPATRGVLASAVLLLVAGTILFAFIEGFSFLDSFYFSFITLATIGYGDFTPTTDVGKIVTVAYSIAGLGIMAALVSTIATQRQRAHGEEAESRKDIGAINS